MVETSPQGEASKAASAEWFRVLARCGFAADGLVHVLIGAIAISVAIGAGGGRADASGALSQVARTPGGVVLLVVVVVALAALGLWQIVHAILASDGDSTKRWARRVGDVSKAVVYFAVAGVAATFAAGGSHSSAKSSQTFSARLLSAPGGVFLLVAIGAGIVAVGCFFIYRGVSTRFTRDIRVPAPPIGTAVAVLGVVGYVAKGLALAVVGVLFGVAAITFEPSKARGLDGALKALAHLPFGAIILIVVGIGVIAYGVYLGARARLARL
jgi:hypothetical protein